MYKSNVVTAEFDEARDLLDVIEEFSETHLGTPPQAQVESTIKLKPTNGNLPSGATGLYVCWLKGLDANETSALSSVPTPTVIETWEEMGLLEVEFCRPRWTLDDEDDKLRYHLDQLDKSNIVVTMGITPNAEFHLGNWYTVINGLVRVNQVCKDLNISPTFKFGFNDLDAVTSGHALGKVLLYADNDHVGELRLGLTAVVDRLINNYRLSIDLVDVSVMQFEPGFRTLLNKIKENHGFQDISLYVVHDECGQKARVPYEVAAGYTIAQTIMCSDPECLGLIYVDNVNFEQPNTFTFNLDDLVMLRDSFYEADVHIFGGDYNREHRVRDKWPGFLGAVPYPYHTLKVYSEEGYEMGKSLDNAVSIKDFKDPQNFVEQLLEIGRSAISSVSPLDYARFLAPPITTL